MEIQDVNLRELVDKAIFSIQDALGDKPLRIEPRFDEPLPRVKTDLAKVNQILFLLLDNAAKFTAAGKIEIHVRWSTAGSLCAIGDHGRRHLRGTMRSSSSTSSSRWTSRRRRSIAARGSGSPWCATWWCCSRGEVSLRSDVGRGTTVNFEIHVQNA